MFIQIEICERHTLKSHSMQLSLIANVWRINIFSLLLFEKPVSENPGQKVDAPSGTWKEKKKLSYK
jgi:hypothetical protein